MNKKELLKTGVGFVVGTGVSTIIGGAVGLVRPRNVGTIKNLCIGLGGMILACMVSDQAASYTGKQIDETVDLVNDLLGNNVETEESKAEGEA